MTIDEFFEHYHFHDSGVNNIIYDAEVKKLHLDIDLCNYEQEGYQEGDPEVSPATLVFTDIENFQSDPQLSLVNFSENEWGEIHDAKHVAARDAMGLEAAQIIINWVHNGIIILTFLASSAVLTRTSA